MHSAGVKTVNLELVRTALDKVDGPPFEKFANAAFTELVGPEYIPLGGVRDWGADAVLSTVVVSKRPNVFYQFSVTQDHRTKIRETVKRLREVGRDLNTLYYATSRIIPRIDALEIELGDELGVNVRCRDGAYLADQVNTSPALLEAFHSYLAPAIAYLSDLQTTALIPADAGPKDAAVYVFLRNELESRESGGPTEGLADSLIIWALRETGATDGIFLTEEQIIDQIDKDVPGIVAVISTLIPKRLKALSQIPQSQQRPIRRHGKENKYCIAFDLKHKMRQENLQAETLRRQVIAVHRVRLLAYEKNASESFLETASRVALNVIQRSLEKEGIEFAAFLRGEGDEPGSTSLCIEECLIEEVAHHSEFAQLRDAVATILYDAYTNPTREERLLYSRIAGVYTILFCLRAEPRLIQYFQRLAGHFRLYVGADVLVQALAERFLPDQQKLFNNTLRLIKAAGGELILTEPVLEEVQRHINASNHEFRNHYSDAEDAITPDTIDIVDRPLIRAYFRGKFSGEKDRPKNWPQFVQNYCDPRAIESDAAKDDLKKSLLAMFKMSFESRKDVERACDGRDVEALAKRLEPYKKEKVLARNDSLMAHLVYVRRNADREGEDVSGYGLRTWWLTNETAITRFTKDLVAAEKSPYLIRPDYLLNFLTLLPKKEQARAIFNSLFPSLLGVHLARDHSPAQVERLHEYLHEIKAVEPERRHVLVAKESDRLKADFRSASWLRDAAQREQQPDTA